MHSYHHNFFLWLLFLHKHSPEVHTTLHYTNRKINQLFLFFLIKLSENIDALFFYIFNTGNPTCNINAEFMFNFVIQDTLISPLVLLLDFLDTQDYLSGSSISPKLESAFHGEIFESLFQIEITNYYHALRFGHDKMLSQQFYNVLILYIP